MRRLIAKLGQIRLSMKKKKEVLDKYTKYFNNFENIDKYIDYMLPGYWIEKGINKTSSKAKSITIKPGKDKINSIKPSTVIGKEIKYRQSLTTSTTTSASKERKKKWYIPQGYANKQSQRALEKRMDSIKRYHVAKTSGKYVKKLTNAEKMRAKRKGTIVDYIGYKSWIQYLEFDIINETSGNLQLITNETNIDLGKVSYAYYKKVAKSLHPGKEVQNKLNK